MFEQWLRKWRSTVSFLSLLLIGLIFFFLGVYSIYSDYSALKYWKPVKALVVDSSVSSGYVFKVSSGYRFKNYEVYYPIVSYTYSFKDQMYTGYWSDYSFIDKADATNVLKKYPQGSKIEVLVNPNNPASSKIKKEIEPFDIFTFIFVIGGLVLFFIVLSPIFLHYKPFSMFFIFVLGEGMLLLILLSLIVFYYEPLIALSIFLMPAVVFLFRGLIICYKYYKIKYKVYEVPSFFISVILGGLVAYLLGLLFYSGSFKNYASFRTSDFISQSAILLLVLLACAFYYTSLIEKDY